MRVQSRGILSGTAQGPLGGAVLLFSALVLCGCHAGSEERTVLPTVASQQVMPTRTSTPVAIQSPPSPTARPVPTQPPVSPTPDSTRTGQPEQGVISHAVNYGETLGLIAQSYSTTVEAILALNGLTDPNSVLAGQTLLVPVGLLPTSPADKLIPDSELVLGPAFSHFDISTFASRYRGYLLSYSEEVDGQLTSGPAIVQLVAQRFSVAPRLLLALLELKSSWITSPNPPVETLYYPMGEARDGWDGLLTQLSWAANQLNRGYYGWQSGWLHNVEFDDGSLVQLAPGLNAGTVAVQTFLALHSTPPGWQTQVMGDGGFMNVYRTFFGSPFQYAIEPLIPEDLAQPDMVLPWKEGETWYLSGGPHGGWGSESGWAALDFVPEGDQLGCYLSDAWARSISSGRVLRSENGEIIVDLDDDSFEGSGWVVFYMHIRSDERVPVGTWLEPGDRIGHPSCEGGFSNGTHVHVSRRYNGQWIEADGPIPFVMDGWTAVSYWSEYDGALVKGDEIREACECREPEFNGIAR